MRLTKLGLAAYGLAGGIIGTALTLEDIVPPLKFANELLDKPAAQQMLLVQDGRANTFLDGTYRSMVTFPTGYAPSFQMRATSNGSECGSAQNLLQPGGEILYADANFYINRGLYILLMPLLNTLGTGYVFVQAVKDEEYKESLNTYLVSAAVASLVPLTQKNWKTNFNVRATPSSGVNQAFSGSISVEKKILFLIPIKISLFNKSRNSISGILPFDSAPGGFFSPDFDAPNNPDVNLFPIVKANLTIRLAPVFTFVPTFSALDIATTPVTASVLYSPYTNGANATFPSRFSNFVTNDRNLDVPDGEIQSPDNTQHVRFTRRISNWIFNQIQQANPIANCSYLCSSLAISGPSSLCNSNTATYSIPGINSPNATVGWTSSNPTVLAINPTTGVATAAAGAANTTVTITGIIDGDCDDSPPYTKTVTVGRPRITGLLIGPDFMYPGSYGGFNMTSVQGATGYSWVVPQGCYNSFYCWEVVNESVTFLTVEAGSTGVHSIEYRAHNACGFVSAFKDVIVTDECLNQLVVSPNPSSTDVTVSLQSNPPCLEPAPMTATAVQSVPEQENTITVFSVDGLQEFNDKFIGLEYKLKKNSLKKGIHIVSVEHLGKVHQARILIE